jgi:hypothetical protein
MPYGYVRSWSLTDEDTSMSLCLDLCARLEEGGEAGDHVQPHVLLALLSSFGDEL